MTETDVARQYPGWMFWESRDAQGQPVASYATRRRDLTDDELRRGLAQTLPVGHGGDLAEQLAEQERLDGEPRR